MEQFPFDWFKELEQVGKAIQTSNSWGEFLGNVQHMIAGSPRASVHDLGDRIKVIVEAPGLSQRQRHQWNFRVADQTLFLKGTLNQEKMVSNDNGSYYSEHVNQTFTKQIPFPAPVKRVPISVDYQNGLVQLIFEKQVSRFNEKWYPLKWNKK
jgi:HSP20 family molecular chaperone IbpA